VTQAGTSQVQTLTPQGTGARWLGTLGHVSALAYSYALPGGPDQLTCTLQVPASYRSDALNPGRTVRAFRGAAPVWDGKLLEATPGPDGWALTANGAGNLGTDFRDIWTAWTDVNDHVNQAIARGLRWVNPGLSNTGLWFGQQADPASQTITDLLNLVCTKGGKTWYVTVTPQANVLSVFNLPAVPDRTLVCTTPVARTLGGDVNSLFLRWEDIADGPLGPAQFTNANVTTAASITAHGTQEGYDDLSSAGFQSSAAPITAAGNAALQRYQRASFAGSFTARYGQVLTTGGQPVDLGTEQAGHVYKVILTDFGYGGEVVPGPLTFLSGAYAYDSATETATITPFQSLDLSLPGILSALSLSIPRSRQQRAVLTPKPPLKRGVTAGPVKRPFGFGPYPPPGR
jgi:hypothetical protein